MPMVFPRCHTWWLQRINHMADSCCILCDGMIFWNHRSWTFELTVVEHHVFESIQSKCWVAVAGAYQSHIPTENPRRSCSWRHHGLKKIGWVDGNPLGPLGTGFVVPKSPTHCNATVDHGDGNCPQVPLLLLHVHVYLVYGVQLTSNMKYHNLRHSRYKMMQMPNPANICNQRSAGKLLVPKAASQHTWHQSIKLVNEHMMGWNYSVWP